MDPMQTKQNKYSNFHHFRLVRSLMRISELINIISHMSISHLSHPSHKIYVKASLFSDCEFFFTLSLVSILCERDSSPQPKKSSWMPWRYSIFRRKFKLENVCRWKEKSCSHHTETLNVCLSRMREWLKNCFGAFPQTQTSLPFHPSEPLRVNRFDIIEKREIKIIFSVFLIDTVWLCGRLSQHWNLKAINNGSMRNKKVRLSTYTM